MGDEQSKPSKASEPPVVYNNQVNPNIAPVNNFSPTIYNSGYDPALSDDQKIVLSVLFTGLATGSAAVCLGENPLYFGSLGALIAGTKQAKFAGLQAGLSSGMGFNIGSDMLAVAGGVLVSSTIGGNNVLSSAIILGAGSYIGDLL